MAARATLPEVTGPRTQLLFKLRHLLQILATAGVILAFGGFAAVAFGARAHIVCPVPVALPGPVCPSESTSPPSAQASAVQLQDTIDNVPSSDTGRVSLDSIDDHGDQLGALDPIVDPDGGYLGVYHSPYRGRSGPSFRVSLAHSSDLLHWNRIRVLDRAGASMPTLRRIPGTGSYLLAYEKRRPGGDVIRIAYYRSRAALLAGRAAVERDLPRLLSAYNDGTPTIVSISWPGSLARSVIKIGFHYQSQAGRRAGADREAIGWLSGLRRWRAYKDPQADAALSGQDLHGSHGDWRQFSFGSFTWRVYEAQTKFDNFGTWHVVLYTPGTRATYPLSLQLDGSPITSVGNPIARQLPAPGGQGNALVVTAFVFAASAPGLTGELVYYQPL